MMRKFVTTCLICNSVVFCVLFFAPSTATATDITLFAKSDVHYGEFQAVDNEARNKRIIDYMNEIPGVLHYPTSGGGGHVDSPRGVIVAGDVTHRSTTDHWMGTATLDGFQDDYLGNSGYGTGRLHFAVFECYGNHDMVNLNGYSDMAKEQVRWRTINDLRRPGYVYNISANGYHYAWGMGHTTQDAVRFINLGLYPGSASSVAQGSLEFLISDLAANVGASGKPVVIMFHYDFETTGWWTTTEQTAFYNAIKNYNVILIVTGHNHLNSMGVGTWNGIRTLNASFTEEYERFAVIHILNHQLWIGACKGLSGWGSTVVNDVITDGD